MKLFLRYDKNGDLVGRIEVEPPRPTRLQWSFSDDLIKTVDHAYNDAVKVAEVRLIVVC